MGRWKGVIVWLVAAGVAAVMPAARAARSDDAPAEPDWKPAFERAYRLAPGEAVKRVPWPYLPERLAYYRANHHDPVKPTEGPAYIIFYAARDGTVREWGHAFGGDRPLPLRSLLHFLVQLKPFEIEGPDELMSLDLMGDWVIDPDAPTAEKLAGMTRVVRAAHGRLVRFERREVEREALVASGRFVIRPLPEVRDPRLVFLYTGLRDPARGGQESGELPEFLRSLGGLVGKPVVDETSGPRPGEFAWVPQNSANIARQPQGQTRQENLAELLRNVAIQTGLKLERARRKVPVWTVVEGPAAG